MPEEILQCSKFLKAFEHVINIYGLSLKGAQGRASLKAFRI